MLLKIWKYVNYLKKKKNNKNFIVEGTIAVRGSDYRPAKVLSDEKDELVTQNWRDRLKSYTTYLICDKTLNGLAPNLSNLFIKAIHGTLYLVICLFTVKVWLCTPPTQHNTRTAPSNTRKALSTSTVKSTWPENYTIQKHFFLVKQTRWVSDDN